MMEDMLKNLTWNERKSLEEPIHDLLLAAIEHAAEPSQANLDRVIAASDLVGIFFLGMATRKARAVEIETWRNRPNTTSHDA